MSHAGNNYGLPLAAITRRAFVLGGLGVLASRSVSAEELEAIEADYPTEGEGIETGTLPDDEFAADIVGGDEGGVETEPEPDLEPEPEPEPEPNPEPDPEPEPIGPEALDDFEAAYFRVHFVAPTSSYRSQDIIAIEMIAASGERRFALIDGGFGPTTGQTVPGYINRYTTGIGKQSSEAQASWNHTKKYFDALGVRAGNVSFYLGTHPHPDHMGCAAELIRLYRPPVVFTPEYDDSYMLPSEEVYLNCDGEEVSGKNLFDCQYNYDRAVAAAREVGAALVTALEPGAGMPSADSLVASPVFVSGGLIFTFLNWDADYRELEGDERMTDANDMCWGLLVEGCGRRVFLGADIENNRGVETALASTIGTVDLMKLNHHGYEGSNAPELMAAASPAIVVDTGFNDWPSPELLDQIESLGARLFSTHDATERGLDSIVVALWQQGIATNFDGLAQGRGTSAGNLLYADGRQAEGGWIWAAGYRYWSDGAEYYKGWKQIDDVWYCFNRLGDLRMGWIENGGLWYFMKEDGYWAASEWLAVNGTYYLFGDDGALVTGWIQTSSGWYYMKESGYWAISEVLDIDGDIYGFSAAGHVLLGWNKPDGYWYFFGPDGKAYADGTFYPDDARADFDAEGHLIQGWARSSKKSWYFMKEDGTWAVNEWVKVFDEEWYCFGPTGAARGNTWVRLNESWYWLQADGRPATGWVKVSGRWHFFDSEGRCVY